MGLYHLLYQSQALATFSLPELLELLQQSRAYNAARGITGILLHAPNGQFLQLLEGEKGPCSTCTTAALPPTRATSTL